MRSDLHLDISEIAGFVTGSRSEQCDETLRHLLKCRDCRSLLPLPTTNELWRSVLEDRDQSQAENPNESPFSRVASIFRSFGKKAPLPLLNRSTAVAAILFFSVAGLSMLLIFGRIAETDDGTIAQVNETYTGPVESGEREVRTDLEAAPKPDPRTESRVKIGKRPNSLSSKRRTDRKQSPVNLETRNPSLSVNPAIRILKRSETRGSGTPCDENPRVRFEINPTESGMKLNWEKVPGANSFTVYLSDLDERLIDQFETENETSYLSTSRLNPETTYKWKLVVSLKGGRTIVATSRNFRLTDLKENGRSITPGRKTAASVRCTEDKQ